MRHRFGPRPPPVIGAAFGTLKGQITRLTNRLRETPAEVPYGTLGRSATAQLHPGRGILFPALRATAYHIRLQLRSRIAAAFPDRREQDKVLRVLLHTPGRFASGANGDWLVLQRPQLFRYAAAFETLVAAANAEAPHVPGQPCRPLHLALESAR